MFEKLTKLIRGLVVHDIDNDNRLREIEKRLSIELPPSRARLAAIEAKYGKDCPTDVTR